MEYSMDIEWNTVAIICNYYGYSMGIPCVYLGNGMDILCHLHVVVSLNSI